MQTKEKRNATVMLCRAGIIGALYTVLTVSLGGLAFGPLQIRPAEALCLLPLFFPEAIPGLFVGCLLSNLFSGYGFLDIVFGSLTTLVAALVTFFIGKAFGKTVIKILLGGIPPVLFNAVVIPLVIILATPDANTTIYWTYFYQFLITQCVWVYAFGTPLVLGINRLKQQGVRYLL